MVTHLHQEAFQTATLEDCGLSELCPSGTDTTSGLLKRRGELLHTGIVLMDIRFLHQKLNHFSNLYHLKFVEENFTFNVK